MERCTGKPGDGKEIPAWVPDSIEIAMHARVREVIEAIVEEELKAALGARKSARIGETRQGYRLPSQDAVLLLLFGLMRSGQI